MYVEGQHVVYVTGVGFCGHCRYEADDAGRRLPTWPERPTASSVDMENPRGHRFCFHPVVMECFDHLGDFKAAWEETRTLVLPPYRRNDPNGNYPASIKRVRVTRIANGFGGCTEVSKELDSETLLTATAIAMCDRFYLPQGPADRSSQVHHHVNCV